MRPGMFLALFLSRLRALREALLDSYVTDSASGAVAAFPDGAAGLPFKSMSVDIKAVQNRTPSSAYPAAILGHGGVRIARTGKNLAYCGFEEYSGKGITIVKLSDGVYKISGTSTDFVSVVVDLPTRLPPGTYTISVNNDKCSTGQCNIGFINTSTPPSTPFAAVGSSLNATKTASSVSAIGQFFIAIYPNTVCDDITIKFQIEAGTEATEFEPGHISVTERSWEDELGTVYGATLELISGRLSVTHANIASYNGEEIAEPWLSSKEVYSAGRTPSTGAQVVYPLAEPLVRSIEPAELCSEGGQNYFFCDTGNSEIVYRADTALYIQKKLAAQAEE